MALRQGKSPSTLGTPSGTSDIAATRAREDHGAGQARYLLRHWWGSLGRRARQPGVGQPQPTTTEAVRGSIGTLSAGKFMPVSVAECGAVGAEKAHQNRPLSRDFRPWPQHAGKGPLASSRASGRRPAEWLRYRGQRTGRNPHVDALCGRRTRTRYTTDAHEVGQRRFELKPYPRYRSAEIGGIASIGLPCALPLVGLLLSLGRGGVRWP